MSADPDLATVEIQYRPIGYDGDFVVWLALPPVDGVVQLDHARELAEQLTQQGGWEIVLILNGERVS